MLKSFPKEVVGALAGILLLLFACVFRQPLEQSMARHMLLQIPALLLAGVFISVAWSAGSTGARWRQYDEQGLTGLFAFSFLIAYWMTPKALDDALMSTSVELWKYGSLLLVGAALPGSLARANRITQLFFLGNFAAMMAVAGMLYQEVPLRLCNFYLLEDQTIAGQGLVALSIGIPLLWLLDAWRAKTVNT